MSAIEVKLSIPLLIKKDVALPGENQKVMQAMLIPSMIASTLAVAILTTFVPQLMPLWMSMAVNRPQ